MPWASLEADPGVRMSFLMVVLGEMMRVTRIRPDSLRMREDKWTFYQTVGRMEYDHLAGGKV